MPINCSDDDEECDVSQTYKSDVNNIEHTENSFSVNSCSYEYNQKLNMINMYCNDICECAYYLSQEFKAQMKRKPGFSVVRINSRGLMANIDKIEMCFEQLDRLFDVITVPETWAKENARSYTTLSNYQMRHIHRQNKQGGGVAIYIKNNLYLRKLTFSVST